MSYRNGYRNGYRRPAPRTAGPRANKFAGPCAACGLEVRAGNGQLTGSREAGWKVTHRPASWHGSPVSGQYVNGCPESTACQNLAGQWGPYASPRCADDTHASQVRDTGGCDSCSREVKKDLGDGIYVRVGDHRVYPVSAPVQAGEGDDLAEVSRRAGSKYAYTSSGARMTMSSRRCIDAPCCGCC